MSITDRIAAIIAEHDYWDGCCRCGDLGCNALTPEWAAHVAEEIDKVFAFVEETRANTTSYARTWTSAAQLDLRIDHRYVSKWEAK